MVFNINEYIILKLENGKTNIYIAGKRFKQCKYLFLMITREINEAIKDKASIDEISEILSNEHEKNTILINPEAEFWGHCSNLQVWAEHNYDTHILHSNLSFPLLRKLTEAGDPQAKQIYKNEICYRIEEGYTPVIQYLIEEDFLEIFNDEEFMQLFHLNREAFFHYKTIKRLLKIDKKLAYFLIYGLYIRFQKRLLIWIATRKASKVAQETTARKELGDAWEATLEATLEAREVAWEAFWAAAQEVLWAEAWGAAGDAWHAGWEAVREAALEVRKVGWAAVREAGIRARKKIWEAIKSVYKNETTKI